jgi:hypothetical protein
MHGGVLGLRLPKTDRHWRANLGAGECARNPSVSVALPALAHGREQSVEIGLFSE